MRRLRWTKFQGVGLLALAPWLSSCIGSDCDRTEDAPQRYSGGNTTVDGSFYESSSIEGPFLYFPSGRVYQLEHGLSEAPAEFSVLLSFSEEPLQGDGLAETAGNQAIVDAINGEYIQVRNDTCAEFYMRLTARIAPFSTDTQSSETMNDGGTPSADAGPDG